MVLFKSSYYESIIQDFAQKKSTCTYERLCFLGSSDIYAIPLPIGTAASRPPHIYAFNGRTIFLNIFSVALACIAVGGTYPVAAHKPRFPTKIGRGLDFFLSPEHKNLFFYITLQSASEDLLY